MYYLRKSHNCPRTFDTNFTSFLPSTKKMNSHWLLRQPVLQLTDGRVKRLICRQICLERSEEGRACGMQLCSSWLFSIVQPSSHFDLIWSKQSVAVWVIFVGACRQNKLINGMPSALCRSTYTVCHPLCRDVLFLTGSSGYHLGCTVAAVSAHQPSEYVKID